MNRNPQQTDRPETGAGMELRNVRIAATLLRIAFGTTMLAHGLLKVLVFTMPGTEAFFVAKGFPAFVAWIVAGAEIAGGLGLIAGVLVRVASLGFVPILIGVIVTIGPNGWQFDAANGGGWEFPAFLLAAALVQALLGPGEWALGPFLARRSRPTVSSNRRLAAA
jgi:putative oxidoreductase